MRKVEEMVKDINSGSTVSRTARSAKAGDAALPKELKATQDKLAQLTGTKVQAKYLDGKGRITIPFSNDKEMDSIVKMLDKIK